MKTRIITAIVLLIVILPCVIWGSLPFKALIGIVAGIAVLKCFLSAIVLKLIFIYIQS